MDEIIKKLIEYSNIFMDLGINNYINYRNDNPTDRFFEPLCKYFKCSPIYDFNGFYYGEICVEDILLCDNGDFSISVKTNGKTCDTHTERFRFSTSITDINLISAFFETLDRIVSHTKEQIKLTKDISEDELWEILENGMNKKAPKGGLVKTMIGKKGNDSEPYKAVVIYETQSIIDQTGCATCGKLRNGQIFVTWSAPLCGTTTFVYDTLSDYKKAMDNL